MELPGRGGLRAGGARTPTYLMYRADLFKKAGLAAPELEDVIRAAQNAE